MKNKEMELLSSIGKFTVRHLDYVFVFITFPIIFDVNWIDPKLYISLAVLVVVRAIMPMAQFLTAPYIKKEISHPVISPPISKEIGLDNEGIVFVSVIDNTTFQRSKIDFPELGKITTKKSEEGEIIAQFPDFRTIRLKKGEVNHLYKALLESEVSFFQPGKWEIMIKVNQLK